MNIILVVSDTLRSDHLSCYGNKRMLTPNLEAFSQRSFVFENAHAGSFPTMPARADLMTGRYTFTYQPWGPLAADEYTLAEGLSAAGMLTMAVADTPFLIRNGYGYDRGFKDFIWVRGQRSGWEHDDVLSLRGGEQDHFAPRTFKAAIDWLERHRDERFFLYIDTWDPHEPWDPPPQYIIPYMPDYQNEQVAPNYWFWQEDGLTERDLQIARACYSGEISMVDAWFGRLISQVERLGLADNTAVIFTSDHGFYFGERGMFGKTKFRWPDNVGFEEGFKRGYKMGDQFSYRSPLYNEVSRVPLLIHLPGAGQGRVQALVSLPDLTPSLFDLAGVPIPPSVQSSSLLPLLRGEKASLHDFVVTSAPLESIGEFQKIVDDQPRKVMELSPSTVTTPEWSLFFAGKGLPIELYDARTDPQQLGNVADLRPGVVSDLHAAFVDWLKRLGTPDHRLAPRLEV